MRTQTYYILKLIICLLISRNFPLSRSTWPINFITTNEWSLGHGCVYIIYRSQITNGITYKVALRFSQSAYDLIDLRARTHFSALITYVYHTTGTIATLDHVGEKWNDNNQMYLYMYKIFVMFVMDVTNLWSEAAKPIVHCSCIIFNIRLWNNVVENGARHWTTIVQCRGLSALGSVCLIWQADQGGYRLARQANVAHVKTWQ